MKNPAAIGNRIKEDVDGSTPRIKHSKQKSLQHSIYEGTMASFSQGISQSYIIPFALILKATAFQVGMLSSLSSLVRPFAQLFGSKLMETNSRKRIILQFVFLQTLMWLPIAGLSFLLWKNMIPTSLPYLLIVLFSILIGFGAVAFPAWFSWMGDLVPQKDRGRYFSIRNRATGAIGLVAVLIGAFILDFFKTKGIALLGFAILFVLASIFRFVSFLMLRKQYAPQFKLKKGYYFSFWNFLHTFDNYGKFAVYQGFFHFALMIASPFFAVYMLQELGFSYVSFMAVTISASVFYLLFSPLIGKFSDRFGNVKLFYIANFALVLTPILWTIFKSPIYLIIFPQLIAGIATAAFIISTTNFTYDSVSPQRRGICITYTNLLGGIGMFLGPLLGGALLNFWHPTSLNPFFFIFFIAAGARLLAGIIFLPRIKDERKVKKLPSRPPLSIDLTNPFRIIQSEIGWFTKIFK